MLAGFGRIPFGLAFLLAEGTAVLVVLTRIPAMARAFDRALGFWPACERSLGAVLPPKPARILLYDAKMLTCLARWVTGRHRARTEGHFSYHRSRQLLILTFVALGAVESAGTHLVLLVVFGSRPWVWIVFALDAYTIVWLLGFYASTVVLPHRITPTEIRLRYGYLSELVVPRPAVRAARRSDGPDRKSGKLIVDDETGTATFACGPATVALDLDPDARLTFRGDPVEHRIGTLHLSTDRPGEFVAALAPTVVSPA